MNFWGPVRWRYLGLFAALLGGPLCLVVHPVPTLSSFAAVAALFGVRALWRGLEPIPPALAAEARPLGLPPPTSPSAALRPVAERMGPSGVARALLRSLGLAQTYARTAGVFLTLAVGSCVAAVVVDVNADSGSAAVVFYAAGIFLATALGLGTVGVGLTVRDSRREARDSKLDG